METRHHGAFKKRPELHELVHYNQLTLEKAFGSSPRLIEILRVARKLDPGVRKRLNQALAAESNSNSKTPSRGKVETKPGVLPLPGDPGATRRPGKKREPYRTGEEAELRHIARQHKWWK